MFSWGELGKGWPWAVCGKVSREVRTAGTRGTGGFQSNQCDEPPGWPCMGERQAEEGRASTACQDGLSIYGPSFSPKRKCGHILLHG